MFGNYVRPGYEEEFLKDLAWLEAFAYRRAGVEMTWSAESSLDPVSSYVFREQDMAAFKVPLEVERRAREIVGQQGGWGRIRATVTDALIGLAGGELKIDVRNGDPDAADKLVAAIHAFILNTVPQARIKTVSEKPYIPVSPEMVQLLMESATELGFSLSN